MKKFTILFLILLCLLFNITTATTLAIGNVFKEGSYKLSDFNLKPDQVHYIQNVSSTADVYVLVFDNNINLYQSIRMSTNSQKYTLLSAKPDYTIVIVGKGDVFFS